MAHKIAMMESGLNKVKPKAFAESDPSEYFFVADYDPEDPDMFDNEMVGDPIQYSLVGLQEAIKRLEEAKQQGDNFNIYRRKFDQGGGSSEEEMISDPYNYKFPNFTGLIPKKK